MTKPDPTHYIWWLAGRASGIVALLLVTASVAIGLTMASKLVRKRGAGPVLVRVHEQTALAGLVAIVVHGATLFLDPWLHAGVKGVLVPFTMGYRPVFSGLGIVAGYLAAILGLSFYARRRIGVKLWRKLHRATVLVWALGMGHAIGAGTDAGSAWFRLVMIATGVPILYLFAVRMLRKPKRAAAKPRPKGSEAPPRLRAQGQDAHLRPRAQISEAQA